MKCVFIFALLLISACSIQTVKHDYDVKLMQCHKQLESQIHALQQAGKLDTQDHFIKHFEFLAVDRFLAHLYSQNNSIQQKQEWLTLAFEKAQIKTLLSLQNNNQDHVDINKFKKCSALLYQNLFESPDLLWSQVSAKQLTPVNNYSSISRFLGAYWIASWIAEPSIEEEK